MLLNAVSSNKPALVKAFGTAAAAALSSAWLSKALLFGCRCPGEEEFQEDNEGDVFKTAS